MAIRPAWPARRIGEAIKSAMNEQTEVAALVMMVPPKNPKGGQMARQIAAAAFTAVALLAVSGNGLANTGERLDISPRPIERTYLPLGGWLGSPPSIPDSNSGMPADAIRLAQYQPPYQRYQDWRCRYARGERARACFQQWLRTRPAPRIRMPPQKL